MIFSLKISKKVYSKKCLKQRHQPPYPSLQQIKVEGILAPKKSPGYSCFLQLNAYPGDRVTKRSVYRSR